MTKLSPVGGWVLIRPDKRAEQTGSGIIIPTSVTEYGHTVGTVLGASKTYCLRDKAVSVDMPVSVGDRVMYRDYLKDLETVDVNGSQCCFIYIEDIVLVLEDSDG
jgi:co-chaperonin GroES (HSP10)